MPIDSWLPIGFKLPDGARCGLPISEGQQWQIVGIDDNGRALVVSASLGNRWIESGVLDPGILRDFTFGNRPLCSLSSGPDQILAPVSDCRSPNGNSEALAFAHALSATRAIDKDAPLQDSIYVERFSRLLPTYSISSRTTDDVVLGSWLTGGVPVSVTSGRRVQQILSWLSAAQFEGILSVAGFRILHGERLETTMEGDSSASSVALVVEKTGVPPRRRFELPGRPQLETFINEHIVEILRHRDRYRALGVGFPSAVVLHGPPGCGKTFAVDRLAEFLGWPRFDIEASTVASPYIHETSRKVAELFEKAFQHAPSLLVIDEMDAFLADRQLGTGHHRVEEVAEFLRRIPEATSNEVLVVALTNRLDLIDPAVLRRGRFDHIIKVERASAEEIRAMLTDLLSRLPTDEDIEVELLSQALSGRPLSDVAFVVREGSRLAARSGKDRLDQNSLVMALAAAPARDKADGVGRIGFS